jgi:type II restriction/modification system DNA methylase subunit YeeA
MKGDVSCLFPVFLKSMINMMKEQRTITFQGKKIRIKVEEPIRLKRYFGIEKNTRINERVAEKPISKRGSSCERFPILSGYQDPSFIL